MLRNRLFIRCAAVAGALAFTGYQYRKHKRQTDADAWQRLLKQDEKAMEFQPQSRIAMLDAIKARKDPFDVLVIGGGATGAGCTLDAAVKGLSVVCVERGDFSSETSSKSTKLVHGGVRYLEKAIKGLDYAQYTLVREALSERAVFLKIAPHLSHEIPILLPIYSWFNVPYYWLGSKVYDLLAGQYKLSSSYFLSRQQTIAEFPLIKTTKLCGAMIYFDGQQNDSRMNLALALTANYHGAKSINYAEVVQLLKSKEGKINGARVKDKISGKSFDIYAKCVINATGPFSDEIKRMNDKNTTPLMSPSSGTHIVLPMKYGSATTGFLDPCTQDGRVIFLLPWEGRLIAGTTDEASSVQSNPIPTLKEVEFIIAQINRHFSSGNSVAIKDVLAAWSGIRPLVKNPNSTSTESLVRNHLIELSKDGLISVSGGKWTTYRSMAEETIRFCIATYNLTPPNPQHSTRFVPLIGSHGYNKSLAADIAAKYALPNVVAEHLTQAYGDRAELVAQIARDKHQSTLLSVDFPYIEAEVTYAVRNEYAVKLTDVLARRLRLSFLDVVAAQRALPRISQLMASELGWSKDRMKREEAEAQDFLRSMGLDILASLRQ